MIELQNTIKVCTCTVVQKLQATVSSPMQMQATQLITRRAVDYRSELITGLENCIKLIRCTKVVQQETDCTGSGAMMLAKRDIMIRRYSCIVWSVKLSFFVIEHLLILFSLICWLYERKKSNFVAFSAYNGGVTIHACMQYSYTTLNLHHH